MLNCRVLCWKPKRVPSERMQNVEPLHTLHPCDHISDHVISDVTDMSVTRGVRKHHKAIEFGTLRIFRDFESTSLLPLLLPLSLDGLWFVVAHGQIQKKQLNYSEGQNGACARRTCRSAASARSVDPVSLDTQDQPGLSMTSNVAFRHARRESRS